MKHTKLFVSLTLFVTSLLLAIPQAANSNLVIPSIPEELEEIEDVSEDVLSNDLLPEEDDYYSEPVAKYRATPTRSDPETEQYLPDILRCDGDEYINKDYAEFPILNNDNNFQGLSETKYDNINGETALAYSFYRVKNESANNPNVAIGILLYQTIKYRIAHPEEEMEVSFSSYRTSPTVAVCVLPQSRYYGYMRALYDRDYDDYGFVRISYLLVECAKMGIKVTNIGQLNSYSVYQYNDEGVLKKKAEPSYVEYFTASLGYECYEAFASGKTVADFTSFKQVEWTLSDKGGCDMQHVKGCASSAYIDDQGNEHHYAVYLSSSNLDTVDYRSSNGGNWSQSGILVSGHKYMYLCFVNYVKLMYEFSYQEGMYEMKNYVNHVNASQAYLTQNGRIDEIPEDKLICYGGTPEDPVFELYFTPLGGNAYAWDIVNNPVCKYTTAMSRSKESIEFAVSNPRVETSFGLYKNLKAVLENKFIAQKNKKNRLCINGNGFEVDNFKALKKGTDIEFYTVKYASGKTHEKDFMFSYVDPKTEERQFISLLTSCNFHSGAYYYQTNSFLVVHENEQMTNRFYNHFGVKMAKGAVLPEGLKSSFDERYILNKPLPELPKTIDVTFKLADSDLQKDGRQNGGGSLFGDNNHWSQCYDYYINMDGHPQIFYRNDKRKETILTFDEVNVAVGKQIRMTITRDASNVNCYIDGELKQTLANKLPSELYVPTNPHVINANWRSGNMHYFRGVTQNLRLFKDPLTPAEVSDKHASIMLNFDFTQATNALVDKTNNYTVRYDKGWLRCVEKPVDYDYSIALIGDTQILSEYHQDKLEGLYSWLLDNQAEEKISFMVGVGDITNKAWDWEYAFDKEQIYRLNGKIPYVINRGDHDVLNKTNELYTSVAFNDVFNDEFFLSNISGQFQEGDLANTYKKIKLGNVDYLFLCLTVGAPDDVLAWANQVCEDNKDCRIVVTTHVYLYRDRTTLDYNDAYSPKASKGLNSGELIWQKLVSKHDNIDYVLCGHDPCDVVTLVNATNDNGHQVTQILSNQQDVDAIIGPTGMVTLLYFTNDGELKAIRNYSSGFNKYGSLSSQMNF